MSQKWNYNGVELEVDLQDADFAERYEKAFQNMEKNEKDLQKAGSNSEIIRGYCKMFNDLFDDIYGPGTSDKLFGGKMNAGHCDEAYALFLDAARACNEEARQRRSAFSSRYSPQSQIVPYQNRQERRAKNRKERH